MLERIPILRYASSSGGGSGGGRAEAVKTSVGWDGRMKAEGVVTQGPGDDAIVRNALRPRQDGASRGHMGSIRVSDSSPPPPAPAASRRIPSLVVLYVQQS